MDESGCHIYLPHVVQAAVVNNSILSSVNASTQNDKTCQRFLQKLLSAFNTDCSLLCKHLLEIWVQQFHGAFVV